MRSHPEGTRSLEFGLFAQKHIQRSTWPGTSSLASQGSISNGTDCLAFQRALDLSDRVLGFALDPVDLAFGPELGIAHDLAGC